MKMSRHIAASSVVSALIFAVTRSAAMSVSALLTGIFIDVDHVAEYFREHGMRLDIRHFFDSFVTTEYKKVYLVFHAWEWLAMLVTAAALTKWNNYIVGAATGVCHHLILDQLFNGCKPGTYFILYRMKKNWEAARIFKKKTGLASLNAQRR